jgi:hypothetical protein
MIWALWQIWCGIVLVLTAGVMVLGVTILVERKHG